MLPRDHIFISYRRDDARGASGRLYDWLRIGFGRDHVYRDVDSTGAGKWRDKINDALAKSAACVAVIGPRWAAGDSLARLKDKDDMVRHELLTALKSDGLTLIPTLVEGARIPDLRTLPPGLRPLFKTWNALPVTEHGWEDDTRRLIKHIAEETSLPVGPDLETLLRTVGAAQQRIAELEQAHNLQASENEALQGTISDLTSKLAEASSNERSSLAAAFAALANGNTLVAEDEFEREYENQRRAEQESRQRGADAARHVANLALLHDTAKAVTFYRNALELDASNAVTARLLGNALVTLGDLEEARTALSLSLQLALAHGNAWTQVTAQGDLGRVAQLLGNLEEAKMILLKALALGEQQLAADPANTRWQRDLTVIHNRVGDLLKDQRDMPAALAEYRKVLAIREALVARDPANTEWQRDLSVSHIKNGDMLVPQGDTSLALAAYRRSLTIIEALAELKQNNTLWQRDLAVSHSKIGDVLVAQGDESAALAAYHKGLLISAALAERDPANTEWQRDLLVGLIKIGDILAALGDTSRALAAYRKSLAVAEALAPRDPANTEWQRDLAVSHEKIGDVLVKQRDERAALAEYRKGLLIREALAARGPANAQWQRDLSVIHSKIGDMLVTQSDEPGALAAYRKSLAIAEVLVAHNPTNAQWRVDLARSWSKLGMIQHGQSAEVRLDYLRRGRGILVGLKASGRLAPRLEPMIDTLGKQIASISPRSPTGE